MMKGLLAIAVVASACRFDFDPLVDAGSRSQIGSGFDGSGFGTQGQYVSCTPDTPCDVDCRDSSGCVVQCGGASSCTVQCPAYGCVVTDCTQPSCDVACNGHAATYFDGYATCP